MLVPYQNVAVDSRTQKLKSCTFRPARRRRCSLSTRPPSPPSPLGRTQPVPGLGIDRNAFRVTPVGGNVRPVMKPDLNVVPHVLQQVQSVRRKHSFYVHHVGKQWV